MHNHIVSSMFHPGPENKINFLILYMIIDKNVWLYKNLNIKIIYREIFQ